MRLANAKGRASLIVDDQIIDVERASDRRFAADPMQALAQWDAFTDWAQKNSFWPLPFGTACCAIEFMGTVSAHYDMSRFGYEVVRFSPRQSDLMIVAGTITDKMAPVLKRIYDQMPDPKWVVSMGACACSGGFYRAYHVMQGIDEIIPVDIYVPGCPPSPEGLMYGILQIKEKVDRDRKALRRSKKNRKPKHAA